MAAKISEFRRSYNSFAGVDIKATFGGIVMAELQAISYSITREKAPVYTMGDPEPRSFSRGKRGIAGTMIFVMFDRHALLEGIGANSLFQSDIDSLRPEYVPPGSNQLENSLAASSSRSVSSNLGGGSTLTQAESALVTVDSDQEAANPWYVDQIPPFDVTLSAANEYGALAVMRIFGVEVLNEGYGISVDDLMSEMQSTYLARAIQPWRWVKPNDKFA